MQKYLCVLRACTIISFSMQGAADKREYVSHELQNLCASIVTFPFSGSYLQLVDGSAFNFDVIGRDNHLSVSPGLGSVVTAFDGRGALRSFHDGMRTPLVLGSMPRDSDAIKRLRGAFGLTEKARIAIHSMNLPRECGWGGVSSLVASDQTLTLFNYPTIDECAPSIIDAMRVLRRLMLRDTEKYDLHYLHCLAGRGRSATIAALYIMCNLYKVGYSVEPEVVHDYLKTVRPQIKLSDPQKVLLKDMYHLIKLYKGVGPMIRHFSKDLDRREAACTYPVIEKEMKIHARMYYGAKIGALFVFCFLVSLLG